MGAGRGQWRSSLVVFKRLLDHKHHPKEKRGCEREPGTSVGADDGHGGTPNLL